MRERIITALIIVQIAVWLGIMGMGLYVAAHFIIKHW